MASTGTPAFFVHPGEASHGDLGMITEGDVVLMLSNSGENSELSDLIHYTRRYGIKLIAITGNAGSTLGKHCDVCLLLPKMPEACPNGLAPTTSTTMMIGLGDALAVALLERMGLTPEQYKVFHPGGKLGRKLMKVSELMVGLADMPLIPDTAKMDAALLELTGKNMGAVVVIDAKNELRGIITDGDLKRHMGPDLLQKPVTAVMTASPKEISQDALAVEALEAMTKKPGHYITSLIVKKDGKLAGLIRLQDCLAAGLA
jgi:arabinose-5-phosphate isomerase